MTSAWLAFTLFDQGAVDFNEDDYDQGDDGILSHGESDGEDDDELIGEGGGGTIKKSKTQEEKTVELVQQVQGMSLESIRTRPAVTLPSSAALQRGAKKLNL